MTLTDAQIERYSRQIIVPRIGGQAQKRLLAARLLLIGDARDIEAPLAYLVGAGVGTISVQVADDQETFSKKIAEMRQLNPDVSVSIPSPCPRRGLGRGSTQRVADESQESIDLALLILGSEAARNLADCIKDDRNVRALVIARLDAPGKIALMPDFADPSLTSPFDSRAEAADFIAMLATAEAFKLIAGYGENPSRATIEFEGYETRVRVHP
jgi:hypothetical protein